MTDVLDAVVGGDTPLAECRSHTAYQLGIPEVTVEAALAQRSDHAQEDDELIAQRASLADGAEASSMQPGRGG